MMKSEQMDTELNHGASLPRKTRRRLRFNYRQLKTFERRHKENDGREMKQKKFDMV
jgi:hypothetical protein